MGSFADQREELSVAQGELYGIMAVIHHRKIYSWLLNIQTQLSFETLVVSDKACQACNSILFSQRVQFLSRI